MRKIIYTLIISIFGLSLISCGSTKIETPEVEKESPVVEAPEDDVVEVIEDEIDQEYLRSIENIEDTDTVSKEEFEADKAEILRIISEMEKIMETGDKTKWLEYIDQASIDYYSNTTNLRKVREKLPNKQIQLHGIGDYFKYVFIPSRKRSKVDEIRYISKTNIKAVEVKEDRSVMVYYYFVKHDNKWFVHIPTL